MYGTTMLETMAVEVVVQYWVKKSGGGSNSSG